MSSAPPHSDNILLVSNGYGEAAISGYIAHAIRLLEPAARVEHFPQVGVGSPDDWPPAIGPRRSMPSGGLVTNWNWRALLRDLGSGLAMLTLAQARFLGQQRQRDAIVAVGDVYCLALCLVFARRPTIVVATAKSDYVAPHSGLERMWMRRARIVFARDEATAASLRGNGINAVYAGNVMMDGLTTSGVDLRLVPDALRVAILPGSRADAAANAADMVARVAAVASRLSPRAVQVFVSVAPGVQAEEVVERLRSAGFTLAAGSNGVIAASGRQGNLAISIVRGAFADLVAASDVVFGQAGTANEQAAGLGRPVIAAAEPGERPDKMRWYRMRQKRLLGDAVAVLPAERDAFVAKAVALLQDANSLAVMAAAGRERMGQSGGAEAVARAALAIAHRRAA